MKWTIGLRYYLLSLQQLLFDLWLAGGRDLNLRKVYYQSIDDGISTADVAYVFNVTKSYQCGISSAYSQTGNIGVSLNS